MPKNQNYNKLRKVWYKKLKASGFNDIERDDDSLKVWSSRINRENTLEMIQTKQEYYYMAEQFLNTYPFENHIERIIWEYHTNAISVRNIVKLLKKAGISKKKAERNIVWHTISRLKTIMKHKYIWPDDE